MGKIQVGNSPASLFKAAVNANAWVLRHGSTLPTLGLHQTRHSPRLECRPYKTTPIGHCTGPGQKCIARLNLAAVSAQGAHTLVYDQVTQPLSRLCGGRQ